MENKKSVLLDVDEVVCFSGFRNAINDFLVTEYEVDDFTNYYMDEEKIPLDRFNEFIEFINNRNLYDDADILPDAVESIEYLSYLYDIYICSSCINPFDIEGSGKLFKDKYDFLRNILPFIKPEKFIFTGTKNIFKADIQIDDRMSNLLNDIETRILFPSYHNKEITDNELKEQGIIRAGYDWRTGWKETTKILTKNINNK